MRIRTECSLVTKQVQLSEAAYDRLKAAKRKGESFSDVVLRAVPEKKDWRRFIGSSTSPLTLEERLAAAEWAKDF